VRFAHLAAQLQPTTPATWRTLFELIAETRSHELAGTALPRVATEAALSSSEMDRLAWQALKRFEDVGGAALAPDPTDPTQAHEARYMGYIGYTTAGDEIVPGPAPAGHRRTRRRR